TVTLFASIFAWVTAFPAPPPQNNNQFQASLRPTANLTYVNGISITHLAGPSVAGTGQIYLSSSTQPTAPEFANPYSISSGLGGAKTWNLGQVWNLTFPLTEMPKAGGNITVYVVVSYQLLFSVILPGTTIAPPPTVTSTAISPATPTIGTIYTVYATVSGSFTANSVYVNLAAVPGGPSNPQKMTLNSQGFWTYTVPSGATYNGTYYGFVNVSNGGGQQSTGIVVITIYPSAGTTNGPLSVGVILVPSPPNIGTTESVQAVVTYTGLVQNAPLNVSFASSSGFTGYAPSGLTISGTSSVTVVSKTQWTIPASPASFSIYANATVAGVGTASGSQTFTTSTLTLNSAGGILGSSVQATGTAFAPRSLVTLSVGGVVAAPTGGSSCSYVGNTITTTAAGGFVCTFNVPAGAPASAAAVLASDSTSGQNASAAYAVTDWTLTSTSGIVGSMVTVTGAGFGAGSLTLTVTLYGSSITPTGGGSCTHTGAAITIPAGGGFTCTFTIPLTAPAGP